INAPFDSFYPFSRQIELNGSGAGAGANGLTITSGFCTVRGLLINRFSGAGIDLQLTGSNFIQNTYIGTDATAFATRGNGIGIRIGAGSPNNTIQSSIISASTGLGISIESRGNLVKGNRIGTGFKNTTSFGNGGDGILIINATNNTIADNTVGANGGDGIELRGTSSTGNKIERNFIGIDTAFSFTARPNRGDGILVTDSASNNLIGEADPDNPNVGMSNVIQFNVGAGVRIESGSGNDIHKNWIQTNMKSGVIVEAGTGNSIVGNSIGPNGSLGIDLGPPGVSANDPLDQDSGANNLQNFPVLNQVRQVFVPNGPENYVRSGLLTGTISSTPNKNLRLDFSYSNTCDQSGYGPGTLRSGTVTLTTGNDGIANYTLDVYPEPGQVYTGIATDPAGNTSEYSRCQVAVSAGLLELNPGYSVDENAGTAAITVSRTGGSDGEVSVEYATSDGTATAGLDYIATNGQLTFADGETTKTISIPILNDALVENTETINLTLNAPSGGAGLAYHAGHTTLGLFDDDSPRPPVIFALGYNQLYSFNSELPQQVLSYFPITGLQDFETIVNIAFRPSTGQLYGLTNNRLYTINQTTGVATAVGTVSFENTQPSFRFNPVTDRIRVVTYEGQNLQLNPDTAQVISVDTPLAFAAGDSNVGQSPGVLALANTNNFAGATASTTYAINYNVPNIAQAYSLATLGSVDGVPFSPNSGQLFTARVLSSFFEESRSIDFSDSGIAYIAVSTHDELRPYLRRLLPTGESTNTPLPVDLQSIAIVPRQRLQLKSSLYSANENSGVVTINLRRTGGSSGTTSVDYATSNGTATAGIDYVATSGTLSFADGETSKTFSIPLMDDSIVEGVESINVTLSNATGGVFVGPLSTATVAIMDEPTEAGTTPIDNADFFVQQHYADFLNRQPDTGGLAFWTNHITQCFTDRLCIIDRRIGTSAAFFIENEFQQTGFYIYRFYQAALGRRPTYPEFTADRSQVVGGANLEAGKQAFATQFVQRQVFLDKYPLTMDGPTFVDALINTASTASGVMDLTSRRADLISRYNAGASQTDSRVRVARALIDDSAFSAAL